MGIMLVYDVTHTQTFDNVTKWLRNIVENANKDVEKIIVGNKVQSNMVLTNTLLTKIRL